MLPTLPDDAALEHFLPPAVDNRPGQRLQLRAPLISTLLAGSSSLVREAPGSTTTSHSGAT